MNETSLKVRNFSRVVFRVARIRNEIERKSGYVTYENLSFQTGRGTWARVITLLTVSFKSSQVLSKSTLFGFRDILHS